jgi:large subunit ribosomal protein L10
MAKVFCAAVALAHTAEGFFAAPGREARTGVVMMGGRKATPLGRTSTLAGKQQKLEEVAAAMDGSLLLFSMPMQGATVKQLSALRSKLPESTNAIVVKNKLMARAVAGSDFEAVSESMLTGTNMWFFVKEDGLRGTIDCYANWVKEYKTDKLDEKCAIKGGSMEGKLLDSKGVSAVKDLPTKEELYGRIAGAIQMAGAKGIAVRLKKAAGGQLVKAINLAYADAEKNPNAPAE